ncbi:MAG: type IVB secretion system apparatus protein IcmL/DotI [Proteobacteria bacterium]|nr:type IVB secretion system apparatus protein IcmL/DotI [Pseudomonadota bacterium]
MNDKTVTQNDDLKYIGTMEMVMLRNYYYFSTYRRLMIVCLCLLIIIIALAFFLRYETKRLIAPRYFATTIEGAPLPLIPLNQPNMQDNALKTWAMEAAVEAYNVNFANYRTAIQRARNYFTPDGYELYLKAIKESRNLDAVKRKKMIVHAQINGQPQILNDTSRDPSFNVNGAYAWRVQIPIVVTYENSNPSDKIVLPNILTITITRMNPLESAASIGINEFVSQGVYS